MISFFEFFQTNGNQIVLNLILQITLLSAIAIILARRYKNNAAARYGILFPALISLLLLSTTSLFLQSKNTSLFYLPVDIEQTQLMRAAPEFGFNELVIPEFELESVSKGSADSELVRQSVVIEKNTSTAWGLLLGLPSYLLFMGIWIGGFLILTMGLLRSFHNIEQVSRSSSQLPLAEGQRLDKLLGKVLPARTRVPFRVSGQISSPMLTGLISPVILLPENFISNLNERQLESVLLHELAHFERKDLLANFLQKVIVTIFWFHPLIHVMDRMIARAREEICDNYVLAKELPLDYSEALLRVSALTSMSKIEPGGSNLAVGMFGSEWKLEQRIGELLDESRERSMKLSRRTGRALQFFLVSFSLLLAACQLTVADSGAANANTEDQSVLPVDGISQQQDVARELERGARQLNDQSEQLVQKQKILAEQSLATEQQSGQLDSSIPQLEEEAQQLAARDGNNVDPQQLPALQDEAAKLQDIRRQLEQESLQLRDQVERLEQQKRSLAEQGLAREEQARRLELDARELESQMRAMADEKEKMLRLQEQLKQESIDSGPAATRQEALVRASNALAAQASTQPPERDDAAVYIQAQATTEPQPQQAQVQDQTQSRSARIARTAGTLGPRIMREIRQIQEYMQPADEDVEADLDAAKELLDRLYDRRFERMNDFEKSTTLSFYTNYYLGTDNYPEAIRSFKQTLTIDTLRDDIRLRTLRSLGQLHAAEENWEESIQNYQLWREASPQEDEVTFRGLSYAHYQLGQFDEALPNWLSYMELVKDDGSELGRGDYAYLNGLYFTLEDFDNALELTKEMILLFNDPVDWQNLRTIFKNLDSQQDTAQIEEELIGALGGNGIEPQSFQSTSLVTDGDYLPLIAVSPQYPTRAAQRGIEGWNLLSFTVDVDGNVIPESITVIDAEPQGVFNRASIRAASKFKFQPRIKDGERMAVSEVEYLFQYRLPNDA